MVEKWINSRMIKTSNLTSSFVGKRVLVTGHTGFKGSWLCIILHQMGAEVFGLSLSEPDDARHCYYALKVAQFIKNNDSAIGDIRNKDFISSVVYNVKPDFLFHLAAQAIVSTSYKDPYLTFTTNIVGVLNILETLRLANFSTTIIIITSDKCYKNKERKTSYIESDEMGGDDPYSASKGAAELIFHSYLASYPELGAKHGIASVRAGNVFGGGDWSRNRLIPDCARELFSYGIVEIRMPQAVRPWTFVIDILFGYLTLASHLRSSPATFRGSWNFASEETKTVAEVVQIFINSIGFGALRINQQQGIGKEAGLLLIDPNKSKQKLGWQCRFPVEIALQHTAEWYRAQQNSDDMLVYSLQFLAVHYFLENV